MNTPTGRGYCAAPINPLRRTVLGCLLAGYAGLCIAPALGQPNEQQSRAAFLAVSRVLTGRTELDDVLGARLYGAFAAYDARFTVAVTELEHLLAEQGGMLEGLQAALEGAPQMAQLARLIVTGWYTGIVGDGEKMRCVAYENALNAVIVSDVLRPPGYCHGPYGSWAREPVRG
jgi:hypothetical protein